MFMVYEPSSGIRTESNKSIRPVNKHTTKWGDARAVPKPTARMVNIGGMRSREPPEVSKRRAKGHVKCEQGQQRAE